MSKKYTTNFLEDTNGSTGSANQVLVSTATGIDWVDGSGSSIIGGPYLPLSAGSSYPLTGDLFITKAVTPLIQLKDTTNNKTLLLGVDDNNSFIRSGANQTFFLQVNGGSSAITVLNNANVGIGTDSPAGKLMVRDDTAGSATKIIVSNGGTVQSGTAARLSFYEGGTEKNYIERRRDGSGKFAFVTPSDDNPFVFENATGEFLRMINGNVGIGVTSPSSRLEVLSAANEEGISIKDSSANLKYKVRQFGGNTYSSFWNASNVEQVRISSGGNSYFNGGNVGIGTTSPIGKLEVQSSVVRTSVNGGADELVLQNAGYSGMTILSSNTTAAQIHFGDDAMSNTGMIQYWNNTNSMTFSTNGAAERMRIDSSGNVGIGTTSPSTKLEVAGTITSTGNLTAYNASPSINIGHDGTNAYVAASMNSSGGNSPMIFSIGNNNIAAKILTNGNFGIGTTSPSEKLEVNGNIAIATTDGATSTKQISMVGGRASFGYDGSISAAYMRSSDISKPLVFVSGTSELMRITGGGNVGIGTTSPGSKLEISSTSDALLELNGGAAANPYMLFAQNGTRRAFIQYVNGGLLSLASEYGDIRMMTGTGGTEVERMRINAGGNVGIGTTNPGDKLEVAGTVKATGYIAQSGAPIKLIVDNGALGDSTELRTGGGYFKLYSGRTGGAHQAFVFATGDNYTSGAERMRITSAGGVSFGSTGSAYGTAGQVLTSAGNASPTWTTPTTGDITGVTAGTGLDGGGTSGSVTLNIDYVGSDNAILSATDSSGSAISTGAKIWYSDDFTIAHGNVSDLPFTNNTGDITGVTAGTNLNGGGTSGSVTVNLDNDITINTVEYTNPGSSGQYYGEIAGFGGIDNALAAGELAVLKTSLGSAQWFEADYNTSINAIGMLGIYTGSEVLLRGKVRLSTYSLGFANGAPVYMGATGAISLSAPTGNGDFVRIIGYVTDYANDEIYFCPDNTWVEITA